MSTGDDERSRESSPSRSSRASGRPSGTRPRQGPANVIEFVDSQDPNVKSAIQRHTAYHSAAQRREARLQSLRRGNQSRYLDWGRRQGTESAQPMSPESRSSSPQTNPGNLLPTPDHSLSRQSSGESSIPPLNPMEESLLQFCRLHLCMQHGTWISTAAGQQTLLKMLSSRNPISGLTPADVDRLMQDHADTQPYEGAMAYMRLDEACTQILLAYCQSLRSMLQEAEATEDSDRQAAQQYLARGTNVLRNRLRDSNTASSDANIQAVLLLMCYTADFGSGSEVNIHADALRTMVAERGGIEALSGNAVLHHQLLAADTARGYHLTLDCQANCQKDLRFPNGFWSAGQQADTPKS